jgi:hypothetical protein
MTTGDSMTASSSASTVALASDAASTATTALPQSHRSRLARCGCGEHGVTACGECHDHRRFNDGIEFGIDGGARIRCDFDGPDGCGWWCC